ncbi:MAG: hypothetical protein JO157_13460 [Acetobacteraceae bacterium]|nr:hypothetical protein [Acetobacteraceae bacterium]
MKVVEIEEAARQLKALLAEVHQGEEIVLAEAGQAVGRLLPAEPRSAPMPTPPDAEAALDELFRLRERLAARGVSWTDADVRAARDEGRP